MAKHLHGRIERWLVNICRMVVSVAFILSGFVKAVDPHGTQYKIEDYAVALGVTHPLPEMLSLGLSVGLSSLEFLVGVMLLFAIHRRLVTRFTLLFMTVMTLVTVWLWIYDPISDCGCFGDAIVLTNLQTLLKNIVLLACTVVLVRRPLSMPRFISMTNQWMVVSYSLIFILVTSAMCLYYLPVFDFRPYHVGADIRKGMEVPEGAKLPELETTFILEKDGEQREFSLDDYPDSTWTFVDSKTRKVGDGYVPPIHDFSLQNINDGEDLTEDILSDPGYTFLLVSPRLEAADDSNFGLFNEICDYAETHGHRFYCVTASGDSTITAWRETTGAEYQFLNADATTLKTIIRSNPGLLLLKQGVVIRKWGSNDLPTEEELGPDLSTSEMGQMESMPLWRRVMNVVGWYVIPLLLLTCADRLVFFVKSFLRRRKALRRLLRMKEDAPSSQEETEEAKAQEEAGEEKQ